MKICIVGPDSELAKKYVLHRDRDEIIRMDSREDRPIKDVFDAMITFPASLRNSKLIMMTHAEWDRVIESTLTAVARALISGLPHMRSGGSVVVVGSIVGSTGGYGCANYAAAKAGLIGLVRSASLEMMKHDVRINLLELGYVDAGMGARMDEKLKQKALGTIPMKRFARVDEVFHALDFLLCQTYMTGNVLTVAGGLR